MTTEPNICDRGSELHLFEAVLPEREICCGRWSVQVDSYAAAGIYLRTGDTVRLNMKAR